MQWIGFNGKKYRKLGKGRTTYRLLRHEGKVMKEETFFFAKNALVLYNGQDWPIIQREKYGDQIKKTQFDSISFSEKKDKR